MIYLHCGLPKTGTCSLQAALVEHQDELAEGGILYPEKWRREVDGSHNDLDGVLSASRQSQAPIAEFKRFLRLHADRDVLLSSESLFLWTTTDEGRDLLLRLLMVAEEVAPVRCIWTLRRLDEVACSWYRQIMLAGIKTAPAARFLGGLKPSPAGLQHIEEAIGEVKYVKYDVAGYHNAELLREFGLPAGVARAIENDIRAAPRRNVSLTHKQAIAVLHAEGLSARAGAALERDTLLRAFRRGDFQFDDDGPWRLVDDSVRRSIHGGMLEASRAAGFTPYPRFFGDDEVTGDASASPLSSDVLSDEDLSRLVDHVRQPAGARGDDRARC